MATASRRQQAELAASDAYTIKLLEGRSRALLAARHLIEGGDCQERAVAALEEAAAILKDAAQNCRDAPFLKEQ